MNKILKAISFVSFIFLIPTTSHAEIDSLWSRSYQLDFLHQGWNMHKTVDDGLIILGRVAYNQEGDWITWDHDNAIIKTDQNGDTLWTSRINLWEGHQSFTRGIIEFDNGEFLFTSTILYPNYNGYPVLIRTDSIGDTLWTKHFYSDNTNDMWILNPINNQGNNYYYCGGTNFGSNDYNGLIVEIDATNGDSLMQRFYGDSTSQFFSYLYKLDDGSFIAGGHQTDSNDDGDFWLVKLDESLNVVWEKTYGGDGYDSMNKLIINTNGNYTMVGRTESFGEGGQDGYVVRTDSDGTVLWDTTFGGGDTDRFYDVVETVNPNTQVYLDELSKLENGSTDCADENLSLILQECQDNGVSAQSAIDFLKRYDAIEADENGYPVFSAKGETLNHYLKQLLDQDYMLEVQDEENAVDGQVAYIYQDMINAGLNPVRSLNNLIHQDLVEVSDAGQILPTETLIGLNLELPSDSLVA